MSTIAVHQRCVCRFVQGAAAVDSLFSDKPQISGSRYGGALRNTGQIISYIRFDVRVGVQLFDTQIDLAHREAGRLEAEVEVKDRKRPKLFGKKPIIPD